MAVSVVVPVYNSTLTLRELVQRTSMALASTEHEIIFVDDGSKEDSWEVISSIVTGSPNVKGIRLGRNFGQHAALVAGIREAQFPITVTIDDDLQNPPEEIPRLIEALQQQSVDVVYGVPQTASHSFWRRIAGNGIRRMINSTLKVNEAIEFSSFRAFKTDLRNAFIGELGPGVSVDALLTWGTASFGSIKVEHALRTEGKSNYTLKSLWSFAIDTVTGYSTLPLRIMATIGFLTSVFGLVLMIFFVLVPFLKGISIQGFPFLASTIILFSGIQLITLGVIGEYLARMHFRIMNKPEYVIAQVAEHSGNRNKND